MTFQQRVSREIENEQNLKVEVLVRPSTTEGMKFRQLWVMTHSCMFWRLIASEVFTDQSQLSFNGEWDL